MVEKDSIMKEYYKIILIFVLQMMLLTVFVTHNFMKNHVYTPTRTEGVIEVMLGVIIFSFSLYSIFVVKRLYKTAQEKHLYKISELKYAQIEEQSKIHQRNKHDLLNHLNILSVLAHEEKYSELKNYLSEYIAEINNVQITVETGLKEMDILLFSKINNAQKKGIAFDFKCSALIKCHKRYMINLISIFSNVLDNAIEACELSQEKKLTIHIKEDPLDYTFIVQNSFSDTEEHNLYEAVNKGISTKGQNRGHGLSIVKSLVNKFDGSIFFSTNNSRFEVQIELPKHSLQNQ